LNTRDLPVVVIGAGPVGLAAAAHLAARGERMILLESGAEIGSGVKAWAHVRTFSPWRYTVDPVARGMLLAAGWPEPDPEGHPSGGELAENYLKPLAQIPAIAPAIRLNARVVSITRQGIDKLKTAGRADVPFAVRIETSQGFEDVLARAVIDASGTTSTPNPLGAGGTPAAGEAEARDAMFYGIPDVLGADKARYAGKRVMVFGSGHSAFNSLLDLARLKAEEPDTEIHWAIRRNAIGNLFGGGSDDQLEARGKLGTNVESLLRTGAIELHTGVRVTAIERGSGGLGFRGSGTALPEVDEVIVATGYRPNLEMTRELRTRLDEIVESPAALAPLIDPNVHSCGTVPPHGAEQLAHPEPNFYTVGMKSYGRAPTFLMLTGYEQVRSVVAALAGDWKAAREVRLVLPETGVCSSDGPEASASSCCGTSAPAVPSRVDEELLVATV
jgi:thioredoxin reductase